MERVILSDGSSIMLEPKRASEVRARIAERAKRNARIELELRFIGPKSFLTGRILGHVAESGHYDRSQDRELSTPRTPSELQAERKKDRKAEINARWEKFTR